MKIIKIIMILLVGILIGSILQMIITPYENNLRDYQLSVDKYGVDIYDGDRFVRHCAYNDNTSLSDIVLKDNQ